MNKTDKTGPGRPRYQMKYPTTKQWTFEDLMETNGVNLNTGKGPNCTKLTLTKNMDRDLWIRARAKNGKKGRIIRPNPNSVAVRLDGIFAEPDSKDGLGRKGFVYSLRAKLDGTVTVKTPKAVKATKAPKATRKARTPRTPRTADVSEATKQYESIKAILAAPTPVVSVTPAPATPETATPVTPVATPTPEPVATPAPVAAAPAPAPETSTAPVAQESANAETATPVVNS